MNKSAVILLGRLPKKGHVKKRLAKDIGEDKALNFYKFSLGKIISELKKIKNSIQIYFYHANAKDTQDLKNWLDKDIKVRPPKSDDINIHLKNAFSQLFKDYKKVISISSDVPDLNKDIILNALNKLDLYDIVIGPDNDGGIYLFGTKKFYPELFKIEKDLNKTILESVLTKIKAKNLTYLLLEKLIDIDTKNDLEIWCSNNSDLKICQDCET